MPIRPVFLLLTSIAVSLLLPGQCEAAVQNLGGEVFVLRSLSSGEPFFFSERALNVLLRDEAIAATEFPDVSPLQLERIRRSVNDQLAYLKLRASKPGLFDTQGCARLNPGEFGERMDPLLSTDELVGMAKLPLTELARRAPHVVVVEITDVMPGLLSLILESVVEARVVEVLYSRGGLLEAGEQLRYVSEFVDLDLGGTRFCTKNSAYFFPKVGGRALLLLSDPDAMAGLFKPHAELELIESSVTTHPYPFLLQEPTPLSLLDLRRALAP